MYGEEGTSSECVRLPCDVQHQQQLAGGWELTADQIGRKTCLKTTFTESSSQKGISDMELLFGKVEFVAV